ncbi:biotin-dependent carboxylase uncharacterized domain-containing protein [Andreprevotia lacus DSM 23236]|jgi:biotin-dependent carboxylase-like uncharacterized protein|uniref:Biotin-dependent carboxylase uncharacterized domain-containing protein n=1 Tax=Andreprevotia lacus DSM 23236 TaxID=1121001 RepID=A0A1W1XKC4_9NEIS|nr:biotin-dependent carboxyltransferase family protein [Andreprevotia lacus]SMC24429.1 biotin-dependent carboxylase uncharacterized domain-containing protein [Andreprevotia lacus DSM 23236]
MTVTILKPGPLSSVQDAGRPGHGGIGLPAGGACDALALQLGNLLVGNDQGAAGIEISLGGLQLRFDRACSFALTGALADATLDGVPVGCWRRLHAQAGQVLAVGYAVLGARLLLCVAGGIEVPVVMGSRATALQSAIGGWQGRALAAGDVLPLGEARMLPVSEPAIRPPGRGDTLRVLPGPEWPLLERSAQHQLLHAPWRLTPDSNRMGAKLAGPPLTHGLGALPSHAVQPGVVQLPQAGQPILLLADAQVTGGYAKPLVVIQADLWRAAQFRPGESLHFAEVSAKDALAALQAQRDWLARLRRVLKLPQR